VVDNRNAGFFGIGGAFNFKSGDASGTAAKMSQEKYGSEAMYLPPAEGEGNEDPFFNQPFVDRSALLRATLNSLAMNNVASVINARKHKKGLLDTENEPLEEDSDEDTEHDEKIKRLEDVYKDEEQST
jgi:hypothetical protein